MRTSVAACDEPPLSAVTSEVVTVRALTPVGIRFLLHARYQPAGQAEKASILQFLVGPEIPQGQCGYQRLHGPARCAKSDHVIVHLFAGASRGKFKDLPWPVIEVEDLHSPQTFGFLLGLAVQGRLAGLMEVPLAKRTRLPVISTLGKMVLSL